MNSRGAALQAAIDELATQFADNLLASLASARLGDMLAAFARTRVTTPAVERRPRVRASDRAEVAAPDRGETRTRAVGYLRENPGGVRAEEFRRALGLGKRAFSMAVTDGVGTGEIRKEGRLRATTYFAE